MERELLFWSVTLLLASFALHRIGWYQGSLFSLTIYSIFPICLNLWWYVTSYAIFLLILPFLEKGLRALGQSLHSQLAIIVLFMWGFLGLIPVIKLDLEKPSVFVFIYFFILLTYYKWYMPALTNRQAYLLIASGTSLSLIYWIISNAIFAYTGRFLSLQNFASNHWFIATMMIGMGMFVLAERSSWHSRAVDFLAGSAFAVYLIHTYPSTSSIWNQFASIRDVYNSAHPLIFGLVAIVAIFVVCLALDIIRQLIFKVTVDRHSGKWFDCLWENLDLDKRLDSLERRMNIVNPLE